MSLFPDACNVCQPYQSPAAFLFFFTDTATTEIYTLSLHDALPIYLLPELRNAPDELFRARNDVVERDDRSEEHTSELQSHSDLVCRLLLEKKKTSAAKLALLRHSREK